MKPILAQRIRAARKSMHPAITQREVAKRLGLSPSAVNLWEAGKTEPSAHDLVEMANWFGVSADWLLGSETAPDRRQTKRPIINTVPVLSPQALAKWLWDDSIELLQTSVAYPQHTAAGMLVASDAMTSTCPTGCYAVVSQAHPMSPGSVVLASVGRTGEPVLRRLVHEGRQHLLVADDVRFPTLRLEDGARLVGRVTEVTMRKMLV